MSEHHVIKGTLILTCAGFLSRFIGFFYRIFLSHTIGAQGLGLFQLTLPIQGLIMSLCVFGIQTSISRLCASRLALGQKKAAADFFWIGTIFSVLLSSLSGYLLYQYADFFAIKILKSAETKPLIQILAFTFPLSALHSCINGYYFAMKHTTIPSVTQLLEQLTRVAASYLFYIILVSEGHPITPSLAMAGTLAGEFIASFTSFFLIGKHFIPYHYSPIKIEKLSVHLKELLLLSLPLTLNKFLISLLSSMETVMIPGRLQLYGFSNTESLQLYGIFTGMAMPLILFPGTLTNSAAVMLLPSIAQLQALGKKDSIHHLIKKLFLLGFFMGTACMLLFYVSGAFLGKFLFKNETAGLCIKTLSFICPFLYLNTILSSIINGLGKTGLTLILSSFCFSIRMSFVFFAIPMLGLKGYLYGLLFSELILTILHVATLSRIIPKQQISEHSGCRLT